MIPAKWPCALSDKLVDWQALAITGGEELIKGKVVLNLGPGYGVEEFLLAHLAQEWIVQDNDADVLTRAMEAGGCPGMYRLYEPLPVIPLTDSSVDLVLDFSTLDNTPDPVTAYAETFRVLRPETGILISTFSNRHVVPAGASSESTFDPKKLAAIFNLIGYDVRYQSREMEARAVIVGQVPEHKAALRDRWLHQPVFRGEARNLAR